MVLSNTSSLEAICTSRICGPHIGVDTSILDTICVHLDQLTSLRSLLLDLSIRCTYKGENFRFCVFHRLNQTEAIPSYVCILSRLITVATHLTDLHLGFGCSPLVTTFFRELSASNIASKLQRFTLSHLTSRVGDLEMFLQTSKDSLQVLILDRVSFQGEIEDVVNFLMDGLCLEEVTLRCINVDDRGYLFDHILDQRPVCDELHDAGADFDGNAGSK